MSIDELTRPDLRRRAIAAYKKQKWEEDRDRDEIYERLEVEAYKFVQDVLDIDFVSDLEFQRTLHSSGNKLPIVVFEVENLTFRGFYKQEKIMTIDSIEFDKKTLYDDIFTVELQSGRHFNSWNVVKTLADIGKKIL